MVGALMEGIYVIVYPHVWIESISESIRLFWRRQIYKVKGKRRRFSRATQLNPNLRKISSFREREREGDLARRCFFDTFSLVIQIILRWVIMLVLSLFFFFPGKLNI